MTNEQNMESHHSIESKEDYEKKRLLVKNAEYLETEKWWYVLSKHRF
jgi:hypothetical protein